MRVRAERRASRHAGPDLRERRARGPDGLIYLTIADGEAAKTPILRLEPEIEN